MSNDTDSSSAEDKKTKELSVTLQNMELPRIPFHRKTNRRYNYQPVYYDPNKEDLENRVRKARGDTNTTSDYAENIRQGFRAQQSMYGNRYNQELKRSRIRTFILIIVFGILVYQLMRSDLILRLFEAFAHG